MNLKITQRSEPGPVPPSLLLVTFLISLPLGTMDFLLPLYGRAVAATEFQIGLLFSVAALLGLVLRPLIGVLADRGWARVLLAMGVGWYGLAMLGYALATSYPALLLARVAQALGAGTTFVSLHVLLAASSPEQARGAVFGRLTSITFLSFLVGGVLAGGVLLYDGETQRELRAALSLLQLSLPLPTPHARIQVFHLLYALYAVCASGALIPALRLPGAFVARAQRDTSGHPSPALALLQRRSAAWLLLTGLLLGMGYNLATPMLPLLLQDRFGPGLAALAIAYVIPGVLYAALPAFFGRSADRRGLARSAALGLTARSLVYALLPLSPSLSLVAALWSLEAAGYSLSSPALQGLLSRAVAPDLRGSLYGLYGLSAGVGSVIGGLLGGWLYQQVAAAAPFWGHAILLVLAALLMSRVKAEGHGAAVPLG